MKSLKYILILITFTNSLLAQDYSYIRKAEKLIDKNTNLPRAMELLDKAEKVDYGFCGNAWATAFWNINYLRARGYYQLGKSRLALAQLDSIEGCSFGGDCEKSDSLKLHIIKETFGKELVIKSFDTIADSLIVLDSAFFGLKICIPILTTDYQICLSPSALLMFRSSGFTLRELFADLRVYSYLEGD